jgi:signal transduction histidine kinase/ligand-binding sensor domain-containing protein
MRFDERTGQLVGSRRFTRADGCPADWINQLVEDREGVVWAGSPGGLIEITDTQADLPRMRCLSESHGIGRYEFQAVALDRSGNLWGGTLHGGAVKIARSGFSGFGPPDGAPWAISLLQTRSGDLCFVGPVQTRHAWALHCFNGQSFDVVQPNVVPGAGTLTWGWNQLVVEDHKGEWWFATREGVARFAKAARPHDLAGRAPIKWYRRRDGLANDVIMRLFEDSRGDIWISVVGEGSRNGLSRWRRTTDTLEHFSNQPNLPDLNIYFPTAFEEDRAGNIWIGFSGDGGVARFSDGRFDPLNARGLFTAAVRNIFRDSNGHMWICSLRGLVRVEDPGAAAPAFVAYTTANGLSSNEASAIVEDLKGRLYIGTAHGIDRLDTESGRFKRYSTRDGLTIGEISGAVRDRHGHLWFGQLSGASRLVPPPDPTPTPPPILITGLEVGGELHNVGPLGETVLPRLELGSRRNQLRVEYVALGFGPGEDLRYQYRLEGGLGEWSAPTSQRSVNFANLAPGSYRFEVRAISADGIISDQPATLEFGIAPPLWQRWWFIVLAAAAAAATLYGAYRVRLQRAVEIATVRTRIATDLHDDIGSNLTKIAILSEVARRQLGATGEANERLSAIARISRESVASMSDVVWAINPKRDTLRDTMRRMRQHAEDVFAGRGVPLDFHAPEGDDRLHMPLDVRREFFLIFKEALNNAVRHSKCRTLRVDVQVNESGLHLRVADDGIGFDTSSEAAGNGMASMRRRAERIDATLDVISAPGHGTAVLLSVPGSYARRLRYPA